MTGQTNRKRTSKSYLPGYQVGLTSVPDTPPRWLIEPLSPGVEQQVVTVTELQLLEGYRIVVLSYEIVQICVRVEL